MWLYWNGYWAAAKIERNVSLGGICPLIYDPKIKYLTAFQETLSDLPRVCHSAHSSKSETPLIFRNYYKNSTIVKHWVLLHMKDSGSFCGLSMWDSMNTWKHVRCSLGNSAGAGIAFQECIGHNVLTKVSRVPQPKSLSYHSLLRSERGMITKKTAH